MQCGKLITNMEINTIETLEQYIAKYQKAGEQLRNKAYVMALEGVDLGLEKGREMKALILQGEVDGAGAERAIMAMIATTKAKEINLLR